MTVHAPVLSADVRLVPLAVEYAVWRRRVIFHAYKWDPQVDDVSTICDHACILSRWAAAHLERLAEALAAETMALEGALLERPDLYASLGLGRKVAAALRQAPSGNGVRVMRFDFHPVEEPVGWALSEVNSDVPGGFAEASALPRLAAAHVADARPGADTGNALVAAISRRLGAGARLGFVHATAYADDRQVMQFLADRFRAAGFECTLMAPDHLRWRDGQAVSVAQANPGPIDGVVRFFPADWLPMLPASSGWPGYFSAHTLACNPVHAVLSQSKRNPLVWDTLGVAMPTWRTCLPPTRDPRTVPWQSDERWLVKPAFGRVGEGLAWRGGVTAKAWRMARWNVRLNPRGWVAQQRFASRPLALNGTQRHLCIGVFTVDGKAAGFYGRLSTTTTIDKHAQDVAILIGEETACR